MASVVVMPKERWYDADFSKKKKQKKNKKKKKTTYSFKKPRVVAQPFIYGVENIIISNQKKRKKITVIL